MVIPESNQISGQTQILMYVTELQWISTGLECALKPLDRLKLVGKLKYLWLGSSILEILSDYLSTNESDINCPVVKWHFLDIC